MNRRRMGHSAVVHDGQAWVLGGMGREPIADVEVFSDEWSAQGALCEPRCHMASVRDAHGALWFIGGRAGQDGASPSDAVDVLVDGELREGPRLPLPLRDSAAVLLASGVLAVIGGASPGGPQSASFWLDGDQWRPGPSLNVARADHLVLPWQGTLWVVGGADTVERFDGQRFVVQGRAGGARLLAARMPEGWWVGGGVDAHGRPSPRTLFVDDGGARMQEPLPVALSGAAVVRQGGDVLAVGGMEGAGVVPTSAVRRLPSGVRGSSLPLPIADAAALCLPDNRLLVCGGFAMRAGGVSNRCWISQPEVIGFGPTASG